MFTKEELLAFNEVLLGRGAPNEEDGVGYNKADFGACSTYFYGLSDAQYADLAKRLVKYCNTQLNVDKELMKETAKHYAELSNGEDRSDGISVNVREDGTLISFRYNETFIEVIKNQPKRRWDAENKNWIVPNNRVIPLLNELWTVGADVKNAMEYVMNHELIQKHQSSPKTEVKVKYDGDMALLKFEYNKDIVDAIKTIPVKDRKWNQDFKFWSIDVKHFDTFKQMISEFAQLKQV